MELGMTKEVMVIIDGLQPGDEESRICIKAPGIYHFRDGVHYIQYIETADDDQVIKNILKITRKKVDLKKSGIQSAQMVFSTAQPTQACYNTPYGNLLLQINTTCLFLKESPEEILVTLHYSLSSDGSPVSDNRLSIRILPKTGE
jgi:uncharacterized beta-barrel protein YwiB (DUF1934 family)